MKCQACNGQGRATRKAIIDTAGVPVRPMESCQECGGVGWKRLTKDGVKRLVEIVRETKSSQVISNPNSALEVRIIPASIDARREIARSLSLGKSAAYL